jgi:hypothetical protein
LGIARFVPSTSWWGQLDDSSSVDVNLRFFLFFCFSVTASEVEERFFFLKALPLHRRFSSPVRTRST